MLPFWLEPPPHLDPFQANRRVAVVTSVVSTSTGTHTFPDQFGNSGAWYTEGISEVHDVSVAVFDRAWDDMR